MNKRILIGLGCVVALLLLLAAPAFAVSPKATDLTNANWRVFNVMPAAAAYWDINQAATVPTGGVQFPIQPFDSVTTGSFAVYLLLNYNVDLTGKTINAEVSWTPGEYKTRSTVHLGAYVRLEFQDTSSGTYDSNDYWWTTGTTAPLALDLNAAVTSGTLTASLADRDAWINQSGKPATDTTEDWIQWQGDVVHMSPYDGFTRAMKNVKQISLSFGSSGSYASGVAVVGQDPATFTMSSFTVTP
jgi:hypothetical protein